MPYLRMMHAPHLPSSHPARPPPPAHQTPATMCDTACDVSVNVPPADYEKIPLAIPSEDPLLNIGKHELLAALRMPYERRFVAEWLFTDSTTHPALPPEAFDNSLAIHLHHDISAPGQCQNPPPRPFRQDPAPSEPSNSFKVSKDIDLLLVPVAKVDGITVGYTFLKGMTEDLPGVTFFSGRFAFEDAKRDYLMVVNGMSHHMTGIVSMRWRDAISRDRSFFAIPKADYGPDNLPSRVLSLQCNVDYEEVATPVFEEKWFADVSADEPVDKISADWMDQSLDDPWPDSLESIGTVIQPEDTDLLPELFQDISPSPDLDVILADGNILNGVDSIVADDTTTLSDPTSSPELSVVSTSPISSSTSHESWLLSGQPPDGVGRPRRPGSTDTSSGAFDMSLLSESLANIEKTMRGKFYSPKVRKDVLHPQTGELLSRCTGQLRADLQPVNGTPLTIFRQIAAQAYYASQMPVTPDVRLLAPASTGRPRVAPLAPRPVPVQGNGKLSEEEEREAKLEAKRIKNRMSAAKSNKKRRAQLEAQRKELAVLRERVEELKGKKMRILQENESLKRLMQQT